MNEEDIQRFIKEYIKDIAEFDNDHPAEGLPWEKIIEKHFHPAAFAILRGRIIDSKYSQTEKDEFLDKLHKIMKSADHEPPSFESRSTKYRGWTAKALDNEKNAPKINVKF